VPLETGAGIGGVMQRWQRSRDGIPGGLARPVRWIAAALAVALCACATSSTSSPSVRAPGAPAQLPLSERRMSDFDSSFKDQPYDFKCGECSYSNGIDACRDIGKATSIVVSSQVAQLSITTVCEPTSSDDLRTRCDSAAALKVTGPELLRGADLPDQSEAIGTHLHYSGYARGASDEFFKRGESYFLYLFPNHDARLPAARWQAQAICPRAVDSY
jgi:hypothetical protein